MGLRQALPDAVFWTDSNFVFQGVWNRGRHFCCSSKAAWADIWKLVWHAVDDRGGLDALRLNKVKAHTTRADVASGRLSARAQAGNELAD
eukprot:4834137-Pyramimonas_sp.AAC.1